MTSEYHRAEALAALETMREKSLAALRECLERFIPHLEALGLDYRSGADEQEMVFAISDALGIPEYHFYRPAGYKLTYFSKVKPTMEIQS